MVPLSVDQSVCTGTRFKVTLGFFTMQHFDMLVSAES